jgi:hypothetical protein
MPSDLVRMFNYNYLLIKNLKTDGQLMTIFSFLKYFNDDYSNRFSPHTANPVIYTQDNKEHSMKLLPAEIFSG